VVLAWPANGAERAPVVAQAARSVPPPHPQRSLCKPVQHLVVLAAQAAAAGAMWLLLGRLGHVGWCVHPPLA
jgi:hypothetical protein